MVRQQVAQFVPGSSVRAREDIQCGGSSASSAIRAARRNPDRATARGGDAVRSRSECNIMVKYCVRRTKPVNRQSRRNML